MKINSLLGPVAVCACIVAVFSISGYAATEDGAGGEAKVCVGEWCVDFETEAITFSGKTKSFVDCARNETCARILAETWIAALEDQEHVDIPISNIMVLRLGRDGAIRSASRGDMFFNCSGPSGPVSACVVAFLLELSKPITYDLGNAPKESVPPNVESSRAGPATTPERKRQTAPTLNKSRSSHDETYKAANPPPPFPEAAAKSGPARSSRRSGPSNAEAFSSPDTFTGPFFDRDQTQQEFIEQRWEDVEKWGL